MNDDTSPNSATLQGQRIAAAAQGLGVEVDAKQAAEWLVAVSRRGEDETASASERASALAHDVATGVFGHQIAMLDFDPDDLTYFRRLATHIRTVTHPAVESAIAISGSAAQGQVQLFPGDCDFFERVHIHAEDAKSAQSILRGVMRATALRAFAEPDIVLVEANLGIYPQAVRERGTLRAAGDPITWQPQDVMNGYIEVESVEGRPLRVYWEDADAGQGWTYLGWIIADRERGRIALASNMLDVTWEAPDGTITSLDGSVDPFFQEIYLEASEISVFAKLARKVEPTALNAYARMMQAQVAHYTHADPNYGKASKRLYNLFRLTDRLEAAAYVRELFDEPTASLYQVPGLLEAADIALRDPSAEIDRATVLKQIDLVIQHVERATEGQAEARIVAELTRLRRDVLREPPGADWGEILDEVRKECSAIVNEFFRARLMGYPPIKEYVEGLTEE